jgi:chaperonin GroES
MSAEAVPQTNAAPAIEVPTPAPVRIEPLFDQMLVLQREERAQIGSFVVAEQYREKPTEGKVLATGAECTAIKAGDTVLFNLFAGTKVPEEYGKNLVMLRSAEIIALLHRD